MFPVTTDSVQTWMSWGVLSEAVLPSGVQQNINKNLLHTSMRKSMWRVCINIPRCQMSFVLAVLLVYFMYLLQFSTKPGGFKTGLEVGRIRGDAGIEVPKVRGATITTLVSRVQSSPFPSHFCRNEFMRMCT